MLRLEPFLLLRNIKEFETCEALTYDGYLEPWGHAFGDGFKMVVRKDTSEERLRFTVGHELCHSFFYELVPELKYCSNATDNQEELLCNVGAAAFLIPATGLRRRAAASGISLRTLEKLSEEYRVSIVAMCLRLRRLRVWMGEVSIWSRVADGTFRVENLYSGSKHAWSWIDASILRSAWQSNLRSVGHTFLYCRDGSGTQFFKPVSYEIARRGNKLWVLHGTTASGARAALPLFDGKRSSPAFS